MYNVLLNNVLKKVTILLLTIHYIPFYQTPVTSGSSVVGPGLEFWCRRFGDLVILFTPTTPTLTVSFGGDPKIKELNPFVVSILCRRQGQ